MPLLGRSRAPSLRSVLRKGLYMSEECTLVSCDSQTPMRTSSAPPLATPPPPPPCIAAARSPFAPPPSAVEPVAATSGCFSRSPSRAAMPACRSPDHRRPPAQSLKCSRTFCSSVNKATWCIRTFNLLFECWAKAHLQVRIETSNGGKHAVGAACGSEHVVL